MKQGHLEAIMIAPEAGAPMQPLNEVEAVPGKGLVGDRIGLKPNIDPEREVTLIEAEALEAFCREYEVPLTHAETRRNLLTRGVALNDWVDQVFAVGEVHLKGIRWCEPCNHLQKMTGKEVLKGLLHRGGLRAQIIQGGTLKVTDPIRLL